MVMVFGASLKGRHTISTLIGAYRVPMYLRWTCLGNFFYPLSLVLLLVHVHIAGQPSVIICDMLCRVLPPTTTQETVFYGVSDVIQSALDGYHVCLFSYGQTGSGKTYTMNGNSGAPGIIPRAVSMLLEASERLGSVGWNFRLEATFIEVYNDVLRDLLAPVKAGAVGSAGARVLDSAAIKHDPKSHTQVCN